MIRQVIDDLNIDLTQRFYDDNPIHLVFNGARTPDLRVHSFNPIACEQYGSFRNRAPHIAGRLAVRGLITVTTPDNQMAIYTGVESGHANTGYGFLNSAQDLQKLAVALGRTDIRITPG